MKTLKAKVLEVLPNSRYRVETETHDQVLAHLSGDMRMKVIRFLPGDEVTVEVSPFDPNHGRIVLGSRRPDSQANPPEATERTQTP